MLSKIRINEELSEELKNMFMNLQKEHKEKVQGIYELYNELYVSGKCESYSLDRIYYVAYTLAAKHIKFTIEV